MIATMRSRVACAALVAAALACNEGLQPNTCPGICGTVTFRGALPESTQAVYVVAYHTFPHSGDSLFTFQPSVGLLRALPLDGPPAFYALPIDTGRYEWVVAVWVNQGFNLTNGDSRLREAGYYRDPARGAHRVPVRGGHRPRSRRRFSRAQLSAPPRSRGIAADRRHRGQALAAPRPGRHQRGPGQRHRSFPPRRGHGGGGREPRPGRAVSQRPGQH